MRFINMGVLKCLYSYDSNSLSTYYCDSRSDYQVWDFKDNHLINSFGNCIYAYKTSKGQGDANVFECKEDSSFAIRLNETRVIFDKIDPLYCLKAETSGDVSSVDCSLCDKYCDWEIN